MSNYLVRYVVYGDRKWKFLWRKVLSKGTMRCRNKQGENEAVIHLKKHLLEKFPGSHSIRTLNITNETERNLNANFMELAKLYEP